MSNTATAHRFTRSQIGTLDLGRTGPAGRRVAALLEVDVTRARRELRAIGGPEASRVPLLSWLISQIAVSIRAQPAVARRSATSIDVTVILDRPFEERRVSLPVHIKDADTKSVAKIAQEVEAAATTPVLRSEIMALGHPVFGVRVAGWLYRLSPRVIRNRLVDRWLCRASRNLRRSTPIVVASGAAGSRFHGWLLPGAAHPISVAMGTVSPKASVINGRIEARDMLHLAVMTNQKGPQGDSATRWIGSLVRGMESNSSVSSSLASL